MADLYKQGYRIVLAHGGGYYVTNLMEKLGKQPVFVKSPSGVVSRYTDWDTLWCYVMGMMWINKQLTAKLIELGANAVGVSGVDGRLLLAKRKEHLIIVDERGRQRVIDGGYTGKITEVNTTLLRSLLDLGYLPVIAPIAISEKGEMLNVDSDQVAYAITTSIRPDYTLFLLDVEGLILEGKVAEKLTAEEAERIFRESSEVTGGMKRKLYMAAQIARQGIKVILSSGLKDNPVRAALSGQGTHIAPPG